IDVEPPCRMMGDGPVRWSKIADVPGQPPRIHPRNSDQPVAFEPGIQGLGGAVVRWRRNRSAQDEAAGGRCRGFDVFWIGSDIADMREGESDNLAGVRRVREDLLIAGDRGVETNFADCRPVGADTPAPKYRPIRENKRGLAVGRSRHGLAHREWSCGQPHSTGPHGAARDKQPGYREVVDRTDEVNWCSQELSFLQALTSEVAELPRRAKPVTVNGGVRGS